MKFRGTPNIFYGWWINLFGAILSGLGRGLYGRGSSAMMVPLASEFGLSRAGASLGAGIGGVSNSLLFPLAGWLSDRVGPKWVITAGVLLTGGGLVLTSFVTMPWQYALVWGVVCGAGMGLGFTIAHDKILTDWFVKRRGMAFGIRFAIISAVDILGLLIISALIKTQGWRQASLIAGLIILAVGVPAALYFVKQKRPEYYGLLPDGAAVDTGSGLGEAALVEKGIEYAASVEETEFTIRQALRTSSFWILTVGLMVNSMVSQGFSLHAIPLLTDMGIDPMVAASMLAIMIFFMVPSGFLTSLVADHLGKNVLKFLLAGALAFETLGITIFLLSPTVPAAYVLLALLGVGLGAYVPADALVRGRYFGRRIYGSIQGISVVFVVPISIVSPVYLGWIHDATTSYATAFVIFAVLAAVTTVMISLIRVPQVPVEKSPEQIVQAT